MMTHGVVAAGTSTRRGVVIRAGAAQAFRLLISDFRFLPRV